MIFFLSFFFLTAYGNTDMHLHDQHPYQDLSLSSSRGEARDDDFACGGDGTGEWVPTACAICCCTFQPAIQSVSAKRTTTGFLFIT